MLDQDALQDAPDCPLGVEVAHGSLPESTLGSIVFIEYQNQWAMGLQFVLIQADP